MLLLIKPSLYFIGEMRYRILELITSGSTKFDTLQMTSLTSTQSSVNDMYQEYEQMRTSRAMPRGELCLNSYCSLVLTKSISNLIRTHDA